MKNVYYIGRDESCDIILQDDSNVISRTHAILRLGKGGKYTISDQSMNGTYVNGIRISTGVDVPVSRTDTISFAHLVDFDWDLIPDVANKRRVIIFSIIGGLLLLAALVWGGYKLLGNKKPITPAQQPENVVPADSLKTAADSTKVIPSEPVAPKEEKKPTQIKDSKKPSKEEPAKSEVSDANEEQKDTIIQKKKVNAIL